MTYYLEYTKEISAAHCLPGHPRCGTKHGHNYIVTVYCKSDVLINGMVTDFGTIKEILSQYDHVDLNDKIDIPTAENIAKVLCDSVPHCYRVDVQETEKAFVSYVK